MTDDLNTTNRFPSDEEEAGDSALVLAASPSFHEFDQWMDVELERLVQRWIHTAAPNAGRPQIGRARFDA